MAGGWLTPDEHEQLTALLDELVPTSGTLGGADYVDRILGAFASDPPTIWAVTTARHGGGGWLELGAMEQLAWRTRIEGSRGRPERELNGPTRGWQETYREGLAPLAADPSAGPSDELRDLAFVHACESLYGDPVYGGNRDGAGWAAVGFAGDTAPEGWSDVEVRDGVARGSADG